MSMVVFAVWFKLCFSKLNPQVVKISIGYLWNSLLELCLS